jgi:hypothetical protein
MNATIIGISSGVITVFLVLLLKGLDKKIIYGLALAGIGFLYVGYTWTDLTTVIMNIVQAIIFLMLAYFGIKKNLYFLIAGYIMHGLWDLIYPHFADPGLLPPHYDLFCSTYDFIIGIYLWIFKSQMNQRV